MRRLDKVCEILHSVAATGCKHCLHPSQALDILSLHAVNHYHGDQMGMHTLISLGEVHGR